MRFTRAPSTCACALEAAARTRRPRAPRAAAGFALVAAIFLLLVLGTMAAFVVTLAANASASTALAVQGTRALEAARAGLEVARYRLRDPAGTLNPGATNLPACFASPATIALPAELAAFTVQVDCQRFPAAGSTPGYHEEGDQRSVYFVLTATASFGAPGSAERTERQLQARVEVCKDPGAPAPTYACR